MAVIDENDQGWIGDPEGGIVEFGTPRSLEIRAREFEDLAAAIDAEEVAGPDRAIAVGTALRIAAMFRGAVWEE